MRVSPTWKICAVAALGLAAAGSATALPWTNFAPMRDTPITRFSPADTKLMSDTVYRTLSGGADGVAVEWSNPVTDSGGSVTPAADPKGRPNCRLAKIENRFRSMHGGGDYIFCKASAKTKGGPPWQLVSPWPA